MYASNLPLCNKLWRDDDEENSMDRDADQAFAKIGGHFGTRNLSRGTGLAPMTQESTIFYASRPLTCIV
jgi:hypothetical protein